MKKKDMKRRIQYLEGQEKGLNGLLKDVTLKLLRYQEENEDLRKQLAATEDTINTLNFLYEAYQTAQETTKHLYPKQVISSRENGTTIILWNDGEKTEVKCSANDTFQPMTGVAMGFLKRLIGRKKYRRVFLKGDFEMIDRDAVHAEREAARKADNNEE